ncbi:hypothetical protein LB504_003127 [Fusarium proliferatum]|nr:hypothetical protein LB504_003127 [Fusarium proliferatum]
MSGLEGLGIVANVLAVVDLSLKVISWCSKYAQDVKNSSDSRARLLQAAITLHYESDKIHGLLTGKNGSKLKASQKLAHAMGSSKLQLRELESLLSDKNNCSSLKWPLRKEEVESAIRNIEKTMETLSEALKIDTVGIILDIDDRTEAGRRRAVIDQLPCVIDAIWDSHAEEHNATCLKNTRKDILRDINDWVKDTTDRAKTVFWLNGMAGTGKSTISRTIARSLSETGTLGASFFFKRGETHRGNISKFVTTIARQLATNQSALEPYIHEAVLQEPTITSKAIRVQFERLIVEPLTRCSNDNHCETPIAIVVDALDECESDADIYQTINLFSGTRDLRHPRPRIFVTSRPDLPIRLGFKDVEGTYQDLILHEIPPQVIENDIAIFLQHETELIRISWDISVPERRRLPADWPGSECVRLLTKRATPLFIFAATVCRFIADRRHGNPEEQLQRFLENLGDDTSSRMDITYKPVLSQLLGSNCSRRKKKLIIHEFQRIVGTIINLASPLSLSALSRLLNIDQRVIDTRLDLLHSVLSIPSSAEEPIRLFHLSFRDYLMDSDLEENQLGINEKKSAKVLVRDCFRVMGGLEPDICHLGVPGKSRSTLKPEFIDACIPPEIQYACIYWISHQLVAGVREGDAEAILEFLEKHLLHWVEALTLLGRVYQITGLMRNLRSILNTEARSRSDRKLIELLEDSIRFVDTDLETINLTPLQIYSSVLVFAPTNSIIRKTFAAELPGYVERVVGTRSDWDPRLRSFVDYNDGLETMDPVRFIVFSPDSTLLCSATNNRVRIWSCDTGECIEDLEADEAALVAFSPNGKYLAVTTGVSEHGLYIMSLEMVGNSSELTQNTPLHALAFSQDSAFLWTCTNDGNIEVWNVETQKCSRKLEFPKKRAGMTKRLSVYNADWTFSLKDPNVLLISVGHKAYVWFLESGEEGKSFDMTFTDDYGNDPVFSPDGKLLATPGTRVSAVRIWDVQFGECLWELDMYDSYLLNGVFSPDSRLLAITSSDDSIRVWELRSGECSAELITRSPFPHSAIAFSPDMEFVVLARPIGHGLGSTIEGWNLKTKALTVAKGCHIHGAKHLLFSQDGKLCISGGSNNETQLWDWKSFLNEPLESASKISSLILSHDASMLGVLTSALDGKEVRLLDTATDGVLWELKAKRKCSWISSFEVSPNSQYIAVTYREYDDSRIEVWKRVGATFKLEQTWESPLVDHISFSSCGKLLFRSTFSSEIETFSCGTGKLVNRLELDRCSGDKVSTAIMDASSVLALGFEVKVQIWKLTSMTCIHMWHTEYDRDLVLSSKGTLLASRSDRKRQHMLLWNWVTGERISEIEVIGVDWKFYGFLPENSGVRTNYGDILLKPGTVSRQCLNPTFTLMEGWIQWRGHKLVKLPPECDQAKTAVTATASEITAVVGSDSQRIVIIKLMEDEELKRLLSLIGEAV